MYANQYPVLSSDGERTYTVSVTVEGEWQCSCRGWTTHVPRRDCKHIKQVKADNGKKAGGVEQLDAAIAKVNIKANVAAGARMPSARQLVELGVDAADAARLKREEVKAKKERALGKVRYGFQLAEEPDIGAEPLPRRMVAEIKYDGHMAMLIDGRIINRAGRDITNRFPEVGKVSDAVIIGEIIVPNENGLGDFSGGIQERNTDNEVRIRILAKAKPAMFMAFDILEDRLDGDLTAQPFWFRRAQLEQFYQTHTALLDDGRHKVVAQEQVRTRDDIKRLRERERARGGEGLMVKDLEAPYEARRGRNWLKVKTWQEREFQIVKHEYTGVGDGFVVYISNKGREQTVAVNDRRMREAVKQGAKTIEVKFLSEGADGALRFPSARRLGNEIFK